MKYHQYTFISHWHIAAPKSVVSSAILRSEDWASWWKSLESVEVVKENHAVGSHYNCTWKSTGYKLHLGIIINRFEEGVAIGFDSSGDLVGKGLFTMSAAGENATQIVIEWNVATTKWWMNVFAGILKPFFILNHKAIMKKGEKGLSTYVTRSK